MFEAEAMPHTSLALPTDTARPESKTKTLEELLDLLEHAPDGPVELDAALLYSPRSSLSASSTTTSSMIGREEEGRQVFSESERFSIDVKDGHGYHGDEFHSHFAQPRDTQSSLRSPPPAPDAQRSQTNARPTSFKAAQRLTALCKEKQLKELEECTFAPKIGRPPANNHARIDLPVEERLLATAGQRKAEAARRVQRQRQEAEERECTFAPRLATSSNEQLQQHRDWRPLHERLGEEWRKKEEARAAAVRRADADVTFKPRLCPASLVLAEQRRRKVEATNASMDGKATTAPTRVARTSTQEEPSFEPTINPLSSRLVDLSSSVPSDFHQRQKYYEKLRHDNMQAVRLSDDRARDCTFCPATSGRSLAVLALSNRRFDQIVEADEERWARMAITESNERAARRAASATQVTEEGGVTFKPKLNPRSLAIAEAGSARRRVSVTDVDTIAAERAARADARRRAMVLKEQRECTFAPNISKPKVFGYFDEYCPPQPYAPLSLSTAVAGAEGGVASVGRRLAERAKERDRAAAEAKKAAQARELSECSFKPDTSKPAVAQPQGPVVPRGLDRFLEVKAAAERQAAAARQRAAKVFHLNPSASNGPTVPRPFKLASEARSAARRKSAK